jgi:type IV fimbrial biogenesis protein FimT
MSKQKQSGFTLIELVVVMALMAVVLGIAAPNIGQMLAKFRLDSAVGTLISDLNVARTESIKSGQPILVVCQGTPCSQTPISWTGGWVMCYDADSNNVCDVTTAVRINPIRAKDALAKGQVLTATSLRVTFFPTGFTNSATMTFSAGTDAMPGYTKNILVLPSGSITSLDK